MRRAIQHFATYGIQGTRHAAIHPSSMRWVPLLAAALACPHLLPVVGRQLPKEEVDALVKELVSTLGNDVEKLLKTAGLPGLEETTGGAGGDGTSTPPPDITFHFEHGRDDSVDIKEYSIDDGVHTLTITPPRYDLTIVYKTKDATGAPESVYNIVINFHDGSTRPDSDNDITIVYHPLGCPDVSLADYSIQRGNPYLTPGADGIPTNIEAWKCTPKYEVSNLWIEYLKLIIDSGAKYAPDYSGPNPVTDGSNQGRYTFVAIHELLDADIKFHSGYEVNVDFQRMALVLPMTEAAVPGIISSSTLPAWPPLHTAASTGLADTELVLGWPTHNDDSMSPPKQSVRMKDGVLSIVGTIIGAYKLKGVDVPFVGRQKRVSPDDSLMEDDVQEVTLSLKEDADGKPECYWGHMYYNPYMCSDVSGARDKVKRLFQYSHADPEGYAINPLQACKVEAVPNTWTAYAKSVASSAISPGVSVAASIGSLVTNMTQESIVCPLLNGIKSFGTLAGPAPMPISGVSVHLERPGYSRRRISETRGLPVISIKHLQIKPIADMVTNVRHLGEVRRSTPTSVEACSDFDRNIRTEARALAPGHGGSHSFVKFELPLPPATVAGLTHIQYTMTTIDPSDQSTSSSTFHIEVVDNKPVELYTMAVDSPQTHGFMVRAEVEPFKLRVRGPPAPDESGVVVPGAVYVVESVDFRPRFAYTYRGTRSTVCARFPEIFNLGLEVTGVTNGLERLDYIKGTHANSPISFLLVNDGVDSGLTRAELDLVGFEVGLDTIGTKPTRVYITEAGTSGVPSAHNPAALAAIRRGWAYIPNAPFVYTKKNITTLWKEKRVVVPATLPLKACMKRAKYHGPKVAISGKLGIAKQLVFLMINNAVSGLVGMTAGLPSRILTALSRSFSRTSEAETFCTLLSYILDWRLGVGGQEPVEEDSEQEPVE